MTKTKIALAALLLAATSPAALAQSYSNQTHRDSAGTLQSAPVGYQQHRKARVQTAPVLQQRDVALPNAQPDTAGPVWYNGSGPTSGGM